MPLECKAIFESLLEWPHRGTGTEDEMMAREMLVTHLEGEPGVDVVEEAFYAPSTYIPFFTLIAAGQLFAIWTASEFLYISLAIGLLFFLSHIFFFDWRKSFLTWVTPKKITANLVAKKGQGKRLYILMAHLDSAPASYAYRPEQVRHFRLSVYFGTGIIFAGVLVPLLAVNGILIPVWGLYAVSILLVAQVFIAGIDYWRFGFVPGANDNLSGVAAAVAAASRLWRRMPADNVEIRLVITSAEEAGMLGSQHYLEQHRDEFADKDVFVVNIDTVGNQNLRFITESGGFTPVFYNNQLTDTARQLARQNPQFEEFQPGKHSVGDFDSIWFQRKGIPSLTLASYADDGLMPNIHTMQDTAPFVDLDQVEKASGFAEAIVRLMPTK